MFTYCHLLPICNFTVHIHYLNPSSNVICYSIPNKMSLNSWFRDINSSCMSYTNSVFITEAVWMRDQYMKWLESVQFVPCCNHGNWPEKMKVHYGNISKRSLFCFQSPIVGQHFTSDGTQTILIRRIRSLLVLVSLRVLLAIKVWYNNASFILWTSTKKRDGVLKFCQ